MESNEYRGAIPEDIETWKVVSSDSDARELISGMLKRVMLAAAVMRKIEEWDNPDIPELLADLVLRLHEENCALRARVNDLEKIVRGRDQSVTSSPGSLYLPQE